MKNTLNRNSTKINIATFWENHKLKKYNYSPEYQRSGDVWSDEKKSFLIDSILKNFPIPPIFLHQKISSDGKTSYDVIDGKQRLTSIIEFLENKIPLPSNFSEDSFGDEKLNELLFSDLNKDEFTEWKKAFWRYELTIENIDADSNLYGEHLIENIFDRLNRNGEPLTRQELRKAAYHASDLYQLITDISQNQCLKSLLTSVDRKRFEDHEIISELLFTQYESQIIAGDNYNLLDDKYKEYSYDEKFNKSTSCLKDEFIEITKYLESLNLDFKYFKISGVSHFFALWVLSLILYRKNIPIESVQSQLNIFYENYRNKNYDKLMESYKNSMSSRTKSAGQRILRIKSLLKMLHVDVDPDNIPRNSFKL